VSHEHDQGIAAAACGLGHHDGFQKFREPQCHQQSNGDPKDLRIWNPQSLCPDPNGSSNPYALHKSQGPNCVQNSHKFNNYPERLQDAQVVVYVLCALTIICFFLAEGQLTVTDVFATQRTFFSLSLC